jgi:hypothetical protein
MSFYGLIGLLECVKKGRVWPNFVPYPYTENPHTPILARWLPSECALHEFTFNYIV